MALIERGPTPRPVLQGVKEIRIPVARERLELVTYFYEAVLGLTPWPAERQLPGTWGAGDARRGVLFEFRHDPEVDPFRRRATLHVFSLEEIEDRLRAHELPYERQRGLLMSGHSLFVTDPIGHRIELRESRPL